MYVSASQRCCGFKSLNPCCTWGSRQSLCIQAWEMKTFRRAKAGNWWLSVPGGYSAPPAGLHLQKRFSVLVADEGLGAASDEPPHLAAPEPHGSWGKQQVIAVWNCLLWGRGLHLLTWPRRSAACQGFRSRTLWGGCQGFSWPIPRCCSSTWAPAVQPGQTEHSKNDYMALETRAKGTRAHWCHLPIKGGAWGGLDRSCRSTTTFAAGINYRVLAFMTARPFWGPRTANWSHLTEYDKTSWSLCQVSPTCWEEL